MSYFSRSFIDYKFQSACLLIVITLCSMAQPFIWNFWCVLYLCIKSMELLTSHSAV